MEVDFFSDVFLEEETIEVDPPNATFLDNFEVEGERCGICMDIVIDRGVLDCCQHWFCFACIDNWASIIHLCPLCQNQFQLITCVPVYDTIGCSNMDEDSCCRDDDWAAEGKNNILSLPVYYIDENAVTCLGGDGCKIRNGSVTCEANSSLDTSVACDSCDLWYHAFCVGFDPEGTHADSWLCPRCVANKSRQKSDSQGTSGSVNQLNPKNAAKYCICKKSSTGKMPVSVANTAQTAVGVPRTDTRHVDNEPSKNCLSAPKTISLVGLDEPELPPGFSSPGSKNLLQQDTNNVTSPELSVHSMKIDEPTAKMSLKMKSRNETG